MFERLKKSYNFRYTHELQRLASLLNLFIITIHDAQHIRFVCTKFGQFHTYKNAFQKTKSRLDKLY